MNELGIQPPKSLDLDAIKYRHLLKWLSDLRQVFPRIRTYSVTIDPTSVSANSESTQTFTVAGLTGNDIITVNKPTKTTGLSILDWFSTVDTVSITFRNYTGSPIDPPSETYLIKATRL